MQAVQLEDRPRVRRPPANRLMLVVPREDARAIRLEQPFGAKVAADRDQAGFIGKLGKQERQRKHDWQPPILRWFIAFKRILPCPSDAWCEKTPLSPFAKGIVLRYGDGVH